MSDIKTTDEELSRLLDDVLDSYYPSGWNGNMKDDLEHLLQARINLGVMAVLDGLEEEMPAPDAVYGVSDFARGRVSYRDQMSGHIEAERKRL